MFLDALPAVALAKEGGFWMLDAGFWMLDAGSSMSHFELFDGILPSLCWQKLKGYCFQRPAKVGRPSDFSAI